MLNRGFLNNKNEGVRSFEKTKASSSTEDGVLHIVEHVNEFRDGTFTLFFRLFLRIFRSGFHFGTGITGLTLEFLALL